MDVFYGVRCIVVHFRDQEVATAQVVLSLITIIIQGIIVRDSFIGFVGVVPKVAEISVAMSMVKVKVSYSKAQV